MLTTATHCLLKYGYQLTKPILADITVQPHWKSDNFQKSLAFTILIFLAQRSVATKLAHSRNTGVFVLRETGAF